MKCVDIDRISSVARPGHIKHLKLHMILACSLAESWIQYERVGDEREGGDREHLSRIVGDRWHLMKEQGGIHIFAVESLSAGRGMERVS